MPGKDQWNGDAKPGAKTPTSTRWRNWDCLLRKLQGPSSLTKPNSSPSTSRLWKKDTAHLEPLLGKEHEEVTDRYAKLAVLQARQKENEPVMPHEQKLRKNLWEVRDCELKLKKNSKHPLRQHSSKQSLHRKKKSMWLRPLPLSSNRGRRPLRTNRHFCRYAKAYSQGRKHLQSKGKIGPKEWQGSACLCQSATSLGAHCPMKTKPCSAPCNKYRVVWPSRQQSWIQRTLTNTWKRKPKVAPTHCERKRTMHPMQSQKDKNKGGNRRRSQKHEAGMGSDSASAAAASALV